MFEEPPISTPPDQPPVAERVVEAPNWPAGQTLPTQVRDDGTLVIDLMPLAPVEATCAEERPDPINPAIVVCARTQPNPRLGAVLPSIEDIDFASAIPRARLKLSDEAEAQANAIKKSVGGFDADGAEVRLKIEF
ncbi:MAG: hypothetical protein AAGB23_04505 [Pseudomonadota bacterium]